MKPNPKNFEPFYDPEGGEWIRIKTGKYKDTIWRPSEMKMTEEDTQIRYDLEFLSPIPEGADQKVFAKIASEVINDIFTGMVNEDRNNNSSKT